MDHVKKIIKKIIEWDLLLSKKILLPEDQLVPRQIASFFAHSGDSWFLLAGLLVVWLLTGGQAHTFSAFFAGAILIQATLVIAIKFLIKRSRPESNWGNIYRNTDPNSFPSGHAVRVAMLATMAWGLEIHPMSWLLIVWAPIVSISRVMLGVHYLVDILAGWVLGIVLAEIMLLLEPVFYQLIPFVF